MTLEPGNDAKSLIPLFPADDVPRILHALLEACVSLRKTSNTEHENRVTSRLWKRLKLAYPFREGPLHINYRAPVLDSDASGDMPEGELDLQVVCLRGSDVYFAIEAKRLRVRGILDRIDSGAREYVKSGMLRFVTGQYAPRMNAGAMLGYVFDGNVPAARDDISKAIEKRRGELRLSQGPGLRRSAVLPGRAIDETAHETNRRKFILFHMFVPV